MTEPSSITIPGVPATISRFEYAALIKNLGLDPSQITHLEFGRDAIVAEVFARDADGKTYDDPFEPNRSARHVITIQVRP